MCPVQLTDQILVSYTATLDSGEAVESVPENKPIALAIGSGRILQAVEASLLGMEPGESKTVRILPEDAFGRYYKSLVHEVPLANFGNKVQPKPGMILSLSVEKDGQEQQVPATVLGINNDTVTIDYNHPLADKAITYTVKLHAIGN
ncbi:FKBP-type peptidyl-prolyl cis-trans isomerase [Desulfogranum mediterraneum]|uniref:FKBP-type peptidyl-prolyl cis-trans isomerase n=1 Tax=Desulfogranum mediterraneum TaxID=160661 RepID=UPI000490CC06|nr:peptidylprolyl isomerase [Desulfogranum mediterraneum]